MPSMAKTFREWNPEQGVMFPPMVLDLVEKDDLVHLILNLVSEQLDLSEIMDQYQEERGYPPMHPQMMTGATALQLLPRGFIRPGGLRGRVSSGWITWR
jgi:hypothetical protein